MADKNDLPIDSKYYFAASPFPATPQAESYCGIGSVEETRRRIKRSIERAEGPSIVIGGPGLGKSLLCNLIANDYRSLYKVALLSEGQIDTSRELLQAIMFQLNLPYRDQEEGELRLALIDFLRPRENSGDHGTLLIVDEAQSLSAELLEEIRMISSIVRDGKPRVRTLLAGGLRLDENLSDPRLASFSQRIAARCYLHALSVGETADYIRQQLKRVGAEPTDLIRDDAISSVHSASDGIPRLINQLMNHVLYFAEQQDVEIITAEIVQDAWADLQQLPMPTRTNPKNPSKASTVDFGPLSDGDDAASIEFGELSDFDENFDETFEEETAEDKPELAESEVDRIASADLESDSAYLEPIDHDQVVSESFEMLEACVQLVAEHERDHFAFDAGSPAEISLADAFAQAFGVESVIAEGHESSDSDREPTFVLGQYEEAASDQADVKDETIVEPEVTSDEAKEVCGSQTTSASEQPLVDEDSSQRFRNFPVVRLSTHSTCASGGCGKASCSADKISSESQPLNLLPAISDQDNATDELPCENDLDAETVCFREETTVTGDLHIAEQVSTDLELNNVSDEPVTSEAAYGTISDDLWNVGLDAPTDVTIEDQVSSSPVATNGSPKPVDPFGDFEDEIALEIHRPSDAASQPVRITAGAPAPETQPSPVLWMGNVVEGNDPPLAETEDLLRTEVISINHAAIDTTPGIVSGHFQGLKTRGHAAHTNAKPMAARDIEVADDRDLLIIEDEVQEADGIVPRAAVPAATKTLNDLTTLFSRIRKG
ncbi:hypothetical protein Poly24_14950 [Rosistilla carotiformis]|uniref:ORC1/DEAH AAA+ ATPase domain-containing protein n=1 Tax=Rosistilla carotiformis TaxID=2528017 RepID=A0A518JQH5_9BACT|nr:AAA family ATPase [Rosistilla carotiformis]QDV67791.1 hypothetical protein Poly24_14950 [Rosistilla carotiformis]